MIEYRKNNFQNRIKRKNFILTVGSLEPRKNIDLLIDAFLNLRKKEVLLDKNLIIVGGIGWKYKSKYNHNFLLSNNIEFVGYVDDIKLLDLYRTCDLYVHPSFYEGYGIPIREAYESNSKILVSDTMETFEASAGSAFTFNPFDVKSLEEMIVYSLDHKINNSPLVNDKIDDSLLLVNFFSNKKNFQPDEAIN
jgi:glycosyltransferase involved in cell wall biosynthesis